MDKLYELKETLCEELEKYGAKDKMSAGDLEVVDKLTHTIKNLDKIIEKYEEGEYSNEGMAYRGGSRGGYSNRGGYSREGYPRENMMGEYSNRRGRGSNAKRDSMGRYSSRYSMDNNMLADLREMMEDAPDEKTRQEFERFIRKMETM